MYTNIHTVEWVHNPEHSTTQKNYFTNSLNKDNLLEFKCSNGWEYYLCTEQQMNSGLFGEYIGSKTFAECNNESLLVYNHDTGKEKNISFDSEIYLD